MKFKHCVHSFVAIIIIVFSIFNSNAQTGFQDITDSSGITHTFSSQFSEAGGGITIVDINNDQLDDILMPADSNSILKTYLNLGNSTFVDTVLFIGLLPNTETKSIVCADMDNDGDKDVFIGNYGKPNQLFENIGGQFIDVSSTAGINSSNTWTSACSWGDYNLDGFIDLYVANTVYQGIDFYQSNYLYKNLGNGTFQDVTLQAGVADSANLPWAAIFFDYNNDLFPDIYIAEDHKNGNVLFKNNGNGTFTDVSLISGANIELDGMCTTLGDYDNDGDLDVYITNSLHVLLPGNPIGHSLIRNNGDGTFTDVADSIGVAGDNRTGWGATFFDYDNDTDLDLFVAHASGSFTNPHKKNSLYQNDGSGNFVEIINVGTDSNDAFTFGNAIGDFNNDGFYDIAITNEITNNKVYQNYGNNNHWIKIYLHGILSNRDGIGSWIEVYCGNETFYRYTHAGDGYCSQSSFDYIIGLGNVSTIDSVIVKWPSGIIDKYYSIASNQKLVLSEGESNCSSLNPVSITVAKSNINCFTQDNGSISLTLSGGNAPFNYLWNTDPVQTTAQISNLTPRYYHCTIIDSSDCIVEKNVEIREPTALLNFFIPDHPSPGMSDGAIDVLVSGGVAPYTFLWSTGNTTEDVSGLSAGNYFVTIVDHNGCAGLLSITLHD